MYKVGLTGGIGVGKSTVSNIFQNHGIEIIDADHIAAELISPGTKYYNDIVDNFGNCIIKKGTLNKRMLRKIIFSNLDNKIWLENLLHPQIIKEIMLKVSSANSPYCILVIPLLIEKNLQYIVDTILVVKTNSSLQKSRAIIRDQSNETLFESIKEMQAKQKELLKYADDIIENNEDKESLTAKVVKLHSKYLSNSSNK